MDVETHLDIPLKNYWHLIKNRENPYYNWLKYIIKDIENFRKEYPERIFYPINLRDLKERIENEEPHEKLTTINLSRTILAFLRGKKLREGKDYYISTTSHGRKNYHINIPKFISVFNAL